MKKLADYFRFWVFTMKNNKLVIIGAGETADLAHEYFTHDSDFDVVAFAESEGYLSRDSFKGLPLVQFEEIEKKFSPHGYSAFVALSGARMNRPRAELYSRTKEKGYQLVNYVSSKAFVWQNVKLGDNCFILENNTLQPYTRLGNNVTLWSGNHIGHRSIVHDHCFITSHVVISGFCEIGAYSYLGVNCTIADNVKIAENNFIGMGGCIVKDTPTNSMFCGAHAKKMSISAIEYFG